MNLLRLSRYFRNVALLAAVLGNMGAGYNATPAQSGTDQTPATFVPTIKVVNLNGNLPFDVEISSNTNVAKKWQGGFTNIFMYPGACSAENVPVPAQQIAIMLPFGTTFTQTLTDYGSTCFYITYILNGQVMGPAKMVTVNLTAPKPVKPLKQ